jgi:arylsulfatase A-like enzyme
MGLAGYERPTTPFLDDLASSGASFTVAVSASSWTKPSTASILTGLTPNVHQMLDFYRRSEILGPQMTARRVLPDSLTTLAECLRQAGFATGARTNNVHAGSFFNMLQGFDDAATVHEANTGEMLDDMRGWLARLGANEAFFFFLFTRDAHTPYRPGYESYRRFNRSAELVPEKDYVEYLDDLNARVRQLIHAKRPVPRNLQEHWVDLYDAGMAELDHALRRLPEVLEQSGRASSTFIIITADHGERLFDHGKIGHGWGLDEAVLRVPLIVTGPGIAADTRVSAVARSIDIYPTVATLVGVKPPRMLQGRTLTPLLDGTAGSVPEVTAFSSTGRAHALRDGDYKLHQRNDGRESVFHLADDPGESLNLARDDPPRARRLRAELYRWLRQEAQLRRSIGAAPTRNLSPAVREQLEALGYLPAD